MNHVEELQIIKDVLSGDGEKYELLVRENQKNVYNHALICAAPEGAVFVLSTGRVVLGAFLAKDDAILRVI